VTTASGNQGRRHLLRWLFLLGTVAGISALHYATPPEHYVLHGIYQRSYYVPVILAAYWYGARGGVLAAALSAVAYVPHIHIAWSHNAPYTVSQYADIIVFFLLGLSVGLIASHERQLANRYRQAAESLETANRDLQESGEQLRRAERLSALGEIAAGLAHELRNPLAGVKGALDIVSRRVADGTPEAEFSGIATRELQRLETLVQEFLDYAKPRAPQFRQADLRAVISRVTSLLGPEAERAGVGLVAEGVETTSDPVRADAEQIEQVLVNVVLNAVQASPRGARVTVRCRRTDGSYSVEVADQGAGISPEVRARIFEPFFTTKERGTGLGLAISQRIVTAHHGEMRVSSEIGQGTVFEVRLPIASLSQPSDRTT
jgi:two-component system sensor histidine kinase HydH